MRTDTHGMDEAVAAYRVRTLIPGQASFPFSFRWGRVSIATKLHWIFRIAVAMEFVGHGAFGIIGKEAWIPYFGVFGFSESVAWQLMPVVGAVDIILGILTLFRPMPAVLAHMTFWGLMTAALRPATGEGVWELLERGGNYAVPLAFLLLSGGGGHSLTAWFSRVKSSSLDHITVVRMAWALRVGTAALLIGHGGFGAFMHKEEWIGYFAEIGIGAGTVASAHLIGVIGWFEIALGVAILFKPARDLLLFVFVWKVGTESLRYFAGEPVWEFIERGGSYAAPLALLYATTWIHRATPSPRFPHGRWVVRFARRKEPPNHETPGPVTYLVECYWPGTTHGAISEAIDRARAATTGISATGQQVRFVRAMFVPEDEAVLIVFEALFPQAVREATEQAGLSADRISVAENVA